MGLVGHSTQSTTTILWCMPVFPEALKWGWGDHDRGISYKMESLYGVSWALNSKHHCYLVVYANLP